MNVQHDKKNSRFFIAFENGDDAELKYRLQSNKEVDFFSTYVPNTQRGKGVGGKLVEKGLAWAKDESFTIHASCWYVRDFLN